MTVMTLAAQVLLEPMDKQFPQVLGYLQRLLMSLHQSLQWLFHQPTGSELKRDPARLLLRSFTAMIFLATIGRLALMLVASLYRGTAWNFAQPSDTHS
jgi:hypothetical protein